MSDKFTPGPWAYATAPDGWCYHIHQAENADFNHSNSCDVAFMTVKCDPQSVQEANARLIAAAPDLLKALTWAVNNPDDNAYWIKQAKDAVAKATGAKP